jgi:hypothetical protein
LPDDENIGLELGDEVDAGEAEMLATLGAKDDGPASLYAYHRSIPKSYNPPHTGVEVREGFMTPVMWLVAPVSTTHLYVLTCSFSSLSCVKTFSSTRRTVPLDLWPPAGVTAKTEWGTLFKF